MGQSRNQKEFRKYFELNENISKFMDVTKAELEMIALNQWFSTRHGRNPVHLAIPREDIFGCH